MFNDPRYFISFVDGKPKLFDLTEREVSADSARRLIHLLQQAYIELASEPDLAGVYLLYKEATGEYKIGMTETLLVIRVGQVRREERDPHVHMIHTITCKNAAAARDLEATFHEAFQTVHSRGEWYHLDDDDVGAMKAIQSYGVEPGDSLEAFQEHAAFLQFLLTRIRKYGDADAKRWLLETAENQLKWLDHFINSEIPV